MFRNTMKKTMAPMAMALILALTAAPGCGGVDSQTGDEVAESFPEGDINKMEQELWGFSWFQKWLDFLFDYRFQVVNEVSGQYNHHMVISFETEVTSLIDFDISLVWDRIQKPREAEDGTVPVQDDFRLTVGLTFEF